MIYPVPAKMNITGTCRVETDSLCVRGDEKAYAEKLLEESGYAVAENAEVFIKLIKRDTRELNYIESSRTLSREKFNIRTSKNGDAVSVEIEFAHRNGLFYALNRVMRGLGDELVLGEIEDYPLFKKRGYIEGFYGKPWSAVQRYEMIMLMSTYGMMNTYYYAPKDDPYHRDKWRELYPSDELAHLKKLTELCGEFFVDFNYCIAPGLSMRYSSEEDYDALLCKVKQLYNIGVRGFGLLLDDIPERLHFEEDCVRFDYETVNAHIYLANRLYDDLKKIDSENHMTLCPLLYHGKGDEYYISKLGQGIEASVDLFWTGKNICSQELTVPEAIRFSDATNHRALYWDNYPVNDAEMQNEMHLGCLEGRDSELYRYSAGLIANTMEYCASSKIPLLTVADYLWNPLAYDGRKSWKKALPLILDGKEKEFELFADNLFTSCLKSENSSIFNAVAAAAQTELYAGNIEKAKLIFTEYLGKLRECCKYISGDSKLLRELRPWAEKQMLACEILEGCGAILNGACEHKNVENSLQRYLRLPQVLYDFSFECFVREVLRLE